MYTYDVLYSVAYIIVHVQFTLRGQLTTLLGPLRPNGGKISERCCISVVVTRYGRMLDGWVMGSESAMNRTISHHYCLIRTYTYLRFLCYDTTATSSSSCTRYYTARTQQTVRAAILHTAVWCDWSGELKYDLVGVDNGDAAAPSLPVLRKDRYRRTFVAVSFIMHQFVPDYSDRFGVHVNTHAVLIIVYILDMYNVFTWYLPGIIHLLSYVWYNHSSNGARSNTTECCCFLLLLYVYTRQDLAHARFVSWSYPSCFMKFFANSVGAFLHLLQ